MTNTAAIIMVGLLLAVTIFISFYTRRATRTTADFYLAGRKIKFFTNASAICGDYFSAASFLGVAAAVYASGLDGVWFGTGFGAAFVPVVVFLAGPLRRFGEYTIPDYLFARFGNKDLARIIGIVMVQLISLFYLAPQMYGAGTTWEVLVGVGFAGLTPYRTGVIIVAIVMAFYVAMGGMKGTTWNQMIQFWVLFTAMILVVVGGFTNGFSYPGALARQTGMQGYQLPADSMTSAKAQGGVGKEGRLIATKAFQPPAKASAPDPVTKKVPLETAKDWMSAAAYDKAVQLATGPEKDDASKKAVLVLPQSSKLLTVTDPATGETKPSPIKFNQPGHRYNALDQFSMVLALVLGTAGLPHIMNRYYTNPSGRQARLTTVWVLGFVATFYILAAIAGIIGREFLYNAVITGKLTAEEISKFFVDGLLVKTDQLMPLAGKLFFGQYGLGHVVAGAFAAMWSTIGGLLMASAASWGHDLYENYINPKASETTRVIVGKSAVVVMAGVAALIGLGIPYFGLDKAYPALIAMMVTWAFSVSASAFVPTLVLATWWRQMTFKGAIAGMTAGGFGSVFFIFMNVLREIKAVPADSLWGQLGQLTFPVLITVPLGALLIVVVSLLDQKNLPSNVQEIWTRIHGTAKERQERAMGVSGV